MFALCPFFVMCTKYLEAVERDVKENQNELPLIWHDVNYLVEVCTLKGERDE